MITNGVSLLGQTNQQITGLNNLNTQQNTLEEQITTGEQNQTLSGYGGTEANTVLNAHVGQNQLQSYIGNISTANQNITLMNQALSSISTIVEQVAQAIQLFNSGGQTNISSIQQQAQTGLSFVENLLNEQSNGQYVFAGSDSTSQPFQSDSTLQSNVQQQVASWLNGTQTSAQLVSNTQGLSGASLGLNPALSSSGSVTVNVDQSINVNYTVKASDPDIQSALQMLSLAANLKVPGAGDVATSANLNTVLTQIGTLASTASQGLDQTQITLGNQLGEMKSIQAQHTQDSQTLGSLLQTDENANTTAAVATMNALQTQLQASYQVTASVSKLSLLNFLNSVSV